MAVNAGPNVGVSDDIDGATGSGNSVTHTYAAAGVYHVTVTAANGAVSLETTLTVTVMAAPSNKLYLPLLEH